MIVVLDNIRSAFNVGSILRTCEGLGIKEVFLCGVTPGHANEKVKKTALGAEEGVKAREFKSILDAIKFLREKNFEIFSLELTNNALDVDSTTPKSDFALIIGNEVSGVSPEALEASDKIIKIPMLGKKESLNVSVAFGIAAYTLLKKTS